MMHYYYTLKVTGKKSTIWCYLPGKNVTDVFSSSVKKKKCLIYIRKSSYGIRDQSLRELKLETRVEKNNSAPAPTICFHEEG